MRFNERGACRFLALATAQDFYYYGIRRLNHGREGLRKHLVLEERDSEQRYVPSVQAARRPGAELARVR